MSNNSEFISPAESECLSQLEEEQSPAIEEIENIQHILWLNFQDSAHYTAALYKDRTSSNNNLIHFQRSAIATTRLYKDSVDAVERAFELGQQYGNLDCRRDVSKWAKRKKRKMDRLDLLRHLTRHSTTPGSSDYDSDELSGVLSGLGVASPRATCTLSPRATCTLSPRATCAISPRATVTTPPRTGESSGQQHRLELQARQSEEMQRGVRQTADRQTAERRSPSTTPPHSSADRSALYVSRKRKAESLFDEFLETVHSAKRNRK